MKYQTTRRAVTNNCVNIVSAGYCDLQCLLRGHEPNAYTSGTHGWNFDVYEIYGITICTGYRNMPGRTAHNIIEFENRARVIMDDYSRNYDERREAVENILREFCAQA